MSNKSLQQLLNDFKASRQAMEKLSNDIPRIMGNESVKVVKENFSLQGYDDGAGVKPWKARDPKTDKAYDRRGRMKGSVYSSRNPLLKQTRNLFNSIKYRVSQKVVEIGVDLGLIPYAEKMNEERQYIPTLKPNIKMLQGFQSKIVRERDKAMKDFKK